MLHVKIEMQALAQFQVRLQHFGLVVASHFEGSARFDTAKDRDEAFLNMITQDDALSYLFFGDGAAALIGKRAPKTQSQLLGCLAYFGREVGRELLEVLIEDFGPTQVLPKSLRTVKSAERTLEAHSIQAVQNAHDILLMPLYKWIRDVVGWNRRFGIHNSFYSSYRVLS